MGKTKVKGIHRILAMILALVMLAGVMPVSALASALPDGTEDSVYTIEVNDEDGNPVEDATVDYTITDKQNNSVSSDAAASDAEGKVKIYWGDYDVSEENPYTISYEVTKEGYIASNDEVEVTNPTGTTTVTLKTTTCTVEVGVDGLGADYAKVTIDGKETESVKVTRGKSVKVKIELDDANKAFIDSVTVNDANVELDSNTVFEKEITVDKNIKIAVTVGTKYTVKAEAGAGGNIYLNNEKKDSLIVENASEVSVEVKPDDGYRISSVVVNGTAQEITDTAEFTTKINVTEDVTVTAEFVKVYTIEVEYNENGQVVVDPETIAGSVTVETGSKVIIGADPNDNYRVSEVIINEVVDSSITGENYGENDVYQKELVADKNYSVKITFAPNRFSVTAADTENGTIVIGTELVDYDNSSQITVIPNTGYVVKTVTVNDQEVTDFETEDDGSVKFTISNITEAKEVKANFAVKEEAALNNVTVGGDEALRVDGLTYIYAKDDKIEISTDKEEIRVYVQDGQRVKQLDNDQNNKKQATLTYENNSTIEIVRIELKYQNQNGQEMGRNWHTVDGVSVDSPLRIVFDTDKPSINLAPEALDYGEFYNDNFTVGVDVVDEGDYSGIQTIKYTISDGTSTQEGTLYSDADEVAKTITETINVEVTEETNNSDNVIVEVIVIDRAGNENKDSRTFKVNCTPPSLDSVTIDGTLHAEAQEGYYNTARTLLITIKDRASSFNQANATQGIKINKDGEEPISVPASMITWHCGADCKEETHTAEITFKDDAQYSWSIEYTNNAGKSLDTSKTKETGTDIYEFTVDKTSPEGTISVDAENAWDRILEDITFGIWKPESVTVTATANDETSPLYDILYYKTDSEEPLSEEELEQLYVDGEFTSTAYTVDSEEKFVVYARITNFAGCTKYIGTNGVVVDLTKSVISLVPDEDNDYGYYNGDVNVKVDVTEIGEGTSVYSGIKSIDYKVIKDNDYDNPTQVGNLYTYSPEKDGEKYSNLKSEWSGNITVKAKWTENGQEKDNNSDNIKVIVTVVDNAGNVSPSEELSLAINVDEVKAEILFEDEADNVVDNHGYFDTEKRTATITVIDRATSFHAENATNGISIVAKDGKGNLLELEEGDVVISGWNSNGNVHKATVEFIKDANYEWSFAYENKAGNELDTKRNLSTGTSITPFSFTVDDTNPYGTITVNENTWGRLLEVLTFGLYNNTKADITATYNDDTSPYIVEYYKTDKTTALKEEELDALYEEGAFAEYKDFSVESAEQFVVYLKITDYAGNYAYISSDGYIVDTEKAEITLNAVVTENPEQPINGIYNNTVTVDIDVKEIIPYSGIKTIDYWVVKDGDEENPTQAENLYTFEFVRDDEADQGGSLTITDRTETTIETGIVPSYEQLRNEWTGSIEIDPELNNSCNVVVYVKVVDNAGNEDIKSIPLDIDYTAPTIKVSFDNNSDNNGNSYFDAQRTATVVITERTHHFDSTKATEGIKITATDFAGNDLTEEELPYTISEWVTEEGATPDEATHTATIFFEKDANYTLDISYADNAGNEAGTEENPVDYGSSVAPTEFTIDTLAPTGTVTATSAEGRVTTWDELREKITFGYWSKEKITLTGTSIDETSPVAKIEYYKVVQAEDVDTTKPLTKEELDKVTTWTDFTSFDVQENEQFVVYIKMTDNAGNWDYISTNGLIVDDQAPLEETIAPEITMEPEQPVNGIYNGDVKVAVKVVDPLVGATYSGLNIVKYRVLNMGKETQSGDLFVFEVEDPAQMDLQQTWEDEIVVDSKLNNSNDVVIEIYAEDNALNSSEDKVSIKIDITDPAIDVTYDNNAADSNSFFKANRTATIVVTERNFNQADIESKIVITNTDGAAPTISAWTKKEGTGNLDDTTWTAKVVYNKDGDYTFDIACADLAGNECKSEDVNYGDSVAPTAFTIDKTIPVIAVAYDNNSAMNGNYYKASRTATITITEHNFNADRVNITVSATDDGTVVGAPSESSWTSKGDTHTATIHYPGDAMYTFDITMSDKAGNESVDFAEQIFYVDKTVPVLEISGVADNSANNGKVAPVITYSDTNYDVNNVKITLVGANRGTVELIGSYSDIHNGRVFTFKDFDEKKEMDDIYTLYATLTDKAGNTTTKEITFSVNRFGSTYQLSDSLKDIVGTYVKEAEDVVITEVNANKLSNVKITLFKNDQTIVLEEGKDYSIAVNGGGGSWYEYVYTIYKKNFADDGVYRLTIYSEDAAGNVAENTLDTKDMEVGFGVDSLNPNINVTNLEKDTTYPVETLTVLMSASDNLILSTITVYLDDYNTPYKTWNAEEIQEILAGNGEFTFDIAGDSTGAHKLKIVCTDAAGNEQVEEIDNFYVTTDLWVRYFNNKPLFYGSIAGAICVAGLLIFFVVRRRDEDEEEAQA